MDIRRYQDYTAEDFVLDDFFKQHVLRPGTSSRQFFQELKNRYPVKEADMQEARKIILALEENYRQKQLGGEEKEALYKKIVQQQSSLRTEGKGPAKRPFLSGWIMKTAAAVLLLIGLGIAYQTFFQPRELLYTTGFGEQLEVNLPDGSLVTLNANTQLRFSNDWKEGADREVWLEGEAFFVVEKKPATQAKFTVHSGSLDVEVLGTQFNVNNRSEKTSVFLQEGVIQLRIRENEKEELLMEEGSLAEFSREEGLRVQTVEAPQRYTSWKDGYILLDGMTLAEAKEKIESIYGLEMVISRDSLLFTNLEGALPSSDLGELLQTLEILLPVKVTKNESTILLE